MTDMTSLPTALSFLPGGVPWLEAAIGLAILAATAFFSHLFVRHILLRMALRLLPDDGAALAGAAGRLSAIVPAILISRGIGAVPHLSDGVMTVARNVVAAFIILTSMLAINAALDVANTAYNRRPDASSRPIKGYVQVVKMLLFAGAAILIVAELMEQSPLLLLSGLGAMAAVLMLVFKDTILSLVASVQLTSNDMLRVGDWIEMPQLNADGDVIDIALHTVKVQNWDKTITTIPTHRLIAESYKNWRGMREAGGRRIKRSLLIDQGSIGFLDDPARRDICRFALIGDYLAAKQTELDHWNDGVTTAGQDPVNGRRATNIGTFRAYVLAYLRAHPRVSKDMTMLVRQLQPGPEGLPLEIYCFTTTTIWADYEAIQSDIFDHLLAILPEFGLRLYQQPSGADVRKLLTAAA